MNEESLYYKQMKGIKCCVVETGTNHPKLTITTNDLVRVKINRDWNSRYKSTIVDVLLRLAKVALTRDRQVTMRGTLNLDRPNRICLRSSTRNNRMWVELEA